MKAILAVLFASLLGFSFLFSPAIAEARGGFGGGFHGGGVRGGDFHGGFHGGGFRGGDFHRGFHHGHEGVFIAPFLGFGLGFLAGSGYWSNGYYYTYPYYGQCQRWVPTGGYHFEGRQDPYSGQWYDVEVPDGYWEIVPCG